MDSVTQIALGSAIAGAIGHKQLGRTSLIIGGVLATLPDLDVLLPATDAVTRFTEHRSFSHSLFVLFPFAFICFTVLKWIVKAKFNQEVFSDLRLFWLCCLPLITHPILDAFTSYGTQLFWPLATHPVAIGSIFAVDPLYTLPLLLGCVFLWRNVDNKKNHKAKRINCIGLILSTSYLLLGLLLQMVVENKVKVALQANHIDANKMFISPLYPSLNWWAVIVVDKDVYYHVKVNVLTNALSFSVKQNLGYDNIDVSPTVLHSLNWFTDGFIRLEEVEGKLIATDLRMKTGDLDYAFQFVVAEKKEEGWIVISPFRL
jgi:inner membrane protein